MIYTFAKQFVLVVALVPFMAALMTRPAAAGVVGPNITSLSPTSATAGGSSFPLTVNGSNFDNTSTVEFNASPISTIFVSPTQLTAVVPFEDIANGGNATVDVANTVGGTSNQIQFPINNPVPTLTGISPATGTVNAPVTLTLTGAGFLSNVSAVNFGSVSLNSGNSSLTVSNNGTTITVSVPGTDTGTAGSVGVSVTNPPANTNDGGTSDELTFTIENTPAITELDPAFVTEPELSNGPTTVTIHGTNFDTLDSRVMIAPASLTQAQAETRGLLLPFANSSSQTTTSLTFDIDAASVDAGAPLPAGQYNILVADSYSTTPVFSNLEPFTIYNVTPVITSVSPDPIPAQMQFGPNQTISITGNNFVTGSTVSITDQNGAVLNFTQSSNLTTNNDGTETITIDVTGYLQLAGQTVGIAVINPAPVQGSASSVAYFVAVLSPNPTISRLPQSPLMPDGTLGAGLEIDGTNFIIPQPVKVPGSAVTWQPSDSTGKPLNGSQPTTLTVSSYTNVKLIANVPSYLFANPGFALVTVSNPNAAQSASAVFMIQSTGLALSSLSPNSIPLIAPNDPNLTSDSDILNVSGAGFDSSSVLQLTSRDSGAVYTLQPVTPSAVTTNQFMANFSASSIGNSGPLDRAGAYNVKVVDLGDTGSNGQPPQSLSLPFTVREDHRFPVALQMISVPYVYSAGTTAALGITGYSDAGETMLDVVKPFQSLQDPPHVWFYNPANSANKSNGGYQNPSSLTPGQGYWITHVAGVSMPPGDKSDAISVIQIGLQPPSPTTVTLQPNWNMIGDPYSTGALASSCLLQVGTHTYTFRDAVKAGVLDDTAYTYNPNAAGGYDVFCISAEGTVLRSYAGYWIAVFPYADSSYSSNTQAGIHLIFKSQ